jgi:uncharacterized protein YjbI with pentapeptide repeats
MLNSKSIGSKITQARKRLNLSQADLAQQIAISSQAVGKWERGESLPDITTLNRLAEILGVDLNYFSDSFPSINTETNPDQVQENTLNKAPTASTSKKQSWNMSQGNWVDADFSGLKNLQEKFSHSNMKSCKFIGSDLSDLQLKGNNIESCDFANSNISNCQIESSNLNENNFRNCSFQASIFTKNNMGNCDFTQADFTDSEFKLLNFSKNELFQGTWNRTTFSGVHLDELKFTGKLEDCIFENCAFYRVTFQNTILINTFFKNNKNLKRIQFVDCQADRMTYEFLKIGKANLTGISMILD